MALKRTIAYIFLLLFPILLALMLPFIFMMNQYYILIAVQVILTAFIALSWNIIGGYAGQLDLAAFAYLGLGGVLAVKLMTDYNITPWIGIIVGSASSSALAFIVGYPMFRFGIREVWYALSTAALVVILHEFFILVMGPYDYYIPPVEGWYYLRFRTWENIYYVGLAFLVAAILINIYISRTRLGYYLKAIREDETAAEAIGIDVRKYKLIALLIYAALVGAVGYLYIVSQSTYSYKTFSLPMSIYIAIIGIIGGLGSPVGVLIAAVLLRMAEEYFRGIWGGVLPGVHYLAYGLLLILVGVFRPEGLSTVIDRVYREIRRALRL